MRNLRIEPLINKNSGRLTANHWFRPIMGFACFLGWTYALSSNSYIFQEYIEKNNIKVISGLNLYSVLAYFAGLALAYFLISSVSMARKTIQICLSLCLCYSFLFVMDHTILQDIFSIFIALVAGCASACYGCWFRQLIPDNSSVKPIGLFICATGGVIYIVGLVSAAIHCKAGLFLAFLFLIYSMYESMRLPSFDETFKKESKRIFRSEDVRSPSLILLFLLFTEIHVSYLYTVVNMHYTEYIKTADYFWYFAFIILILITMRYCTSFRPQQSINYMFLGLALAYILYDCLPHTLTTYIILITISMAVQGLAEIMSLVQLRHILSCNAHSIHVFVCHLLINFTGRILGCASAQFLLQFQVFQKNFTNIAVLFVLLCIAIFSFWLQKIIDNAPLQVSAAKPELPQKQPDLLPLLHKTLSDRETQIALMIIDGKTQKEIAEAISLSENTIKFHTKNIYTKLDIHSKQELKNYCKQLS